MYFKITLTTSGGLTSEQCQSFAQYFKKECDHCYLVIEQGDSGTNRHVEGVIDIDTVKTNNVTTRIKTLYRKLHLEVTDYSIRVKKATHLIGALIYASKELKTHGTKLMLKGWEQTWIDKQVKENVKHIPHSILKKKGTRLTQSTGAAVMHEFAVANNMTVTCKDDFLYLGKAMGNEGYLFGSCRPKGLYMDLMALFDSGQGVFDVWEQELHFV